MIEHGFRQLNFEGGSCYPDPRHIIEDLVDEAWACAPQELGLGYYVYDRGSPFFVVCTELSFTRRALVATVTKSGYLANPQLIVDVNASRSSTVTEVDLKKHWDFLEDFHPWQKVDKAVLANEFNMYVELLDGNEIRQYLGGKKIDSRRLMELVIKWGLNK